MDCKSCEERRKLFARARAAYAKGDIETAKALMRELAKSSLNSIKALVTPQ